MSEASEFEVTLTGFAYGGDAIGRLPDGRAVFVPYAIPGEKVRIVVVDEKPRYVLARLDEVLVPDKERIVARCRHFGICGGCHYQYMPYESQLAAKTGILVDQLTRIGKLTNIPIEPIVASPESWNYRNHVQFHLTTVGRLGYSQARSNEIIPIEECLLPQQPLDELWPMLAIEPGTGIQRIGLRLGDDQDVQITLESSSGEIPEFTSEDLNASVVHLKDDSRVVLAGSEYTWMSILGRRYRVSAGTFFQVNTRVAEKMVETVLSELPRKNDLKILEVFCGAGLFSAFLAREVAKLVAIESSAQACEDFSYNLDEFDNVELYEAAAEIVIPALTLHPDMVLVDPPRNGLLRPVMQGLLKMRAQQIIYVSCDPATLARDARYLVEGGYELTRVIPFDMFPQTYHIESISSWLLRT